METEKVCCEIAMTVGDSDLFLNKAQMARCQRDFVAKFTVMSGPCRCASGKKIVEQEHSC